ncbi:MAG: phospholipase [Muribaculaceae bacterium]|nr:phospholipase [Muribaculaceae bacterium]
MTAALIILVSLLVVGGLCLAYEVYCRRRGIAERPTAPQPAPEGCCGQHAVCEKDSLLAAVSERVEYFDDEELDAYAGRVPESYTDDEVEQFRDVLLTLLPADVAPWGRSLQLRGIELPSDVRDELLMMVAEQRMS